MLLADGVAVESYLDSGNRPSFANGGDALRIHPDFSRKIWEENGFGKLVAEGPAPAEPGWRLTAAR